MTGLAADPICKEHLTGPQHPEQPARFDAAVGALRGSGAGSDSAPARQSRRTRAVPLAPATSSWPSARSCEGFHELSTGDTIISPKSLDAALRATGGALNAVDAIVEKRVSNAISIGRPPGHHANAARGMGFCIFNTVAIAARYAQKKHGIGRVLIADWDVHHGNGTQDIFYTDGTVFFFSTHQSPWYPGTGAAKRTRRGRGRRHDAELSVSSGRRTQGDPGRVPGAIAGRGGTSKARAGADFRRASIPEPAIRWGNSCLPTTTSRI